MPMIAAAHIQAPTRGVIGNDLREIYDIRPGITGTTCVYFFDVFGTADYRRYRSDDLIEIVDRHAP